MSVLRTCLHCGAQAEQSTMHKQQPGKYLCDACASAHYIKCERCETLTLRTSVFSIKTLSGPVNVCSKCKPKFKPCALCRSLVDIDKALMTPDGPVCPEHQDLYKQLDITTRDPKLWYQLDNLEYVPDEKNNMHWVHNSSMTHIPNRESMPLERFNILFPQKGALYSCTLCDKTVLAREAALIHESADKTKVGLFCPDCYSKAHIADCGHPTLNVSAASIVPLLPGTSIQVDIDGIADSNIGPDQDTSEMILQKKHVCGACALRAILSQRSDAVRQRESYVLNYQWNPSEMFFHKLEAPEENGPFMGFELEVDLGRNIESTCQEILKEVGRKHVYIKRDGSLRNGFEQVTHPATIDYYLNQRERYEKLLHIPKANGFVSHDSGTCGLHVHVDRKFFSSAMRDEGILRVLFLTEKFFPEVFIFSRRDPASAEKWAARWLTANEGALLSAADMKSFFERKIASDDNRRKLVNLQRSPTLEFRIFRGTLNPVSFWATLQLVNNFMVAAAKYTDPAELDALTWMDIIKVREFPELTEYNAHRIGDAWSGTVQITAPLSTDSGAGQGTETLNIPSVLPKDSVQRCVGYHFKIETNEVFRALLPRVIDQLNERKEYFVDGARTGKTFLMQAPLPLAIQPVENKPFQVVATLGTNTYALKDIIIKDSFVARLPTAISEVLLGAADAVLNCATFS